MHIRKISKPAPALTGFFDPSMISAKANWINAVVNLFELERFFGIDLDPKAT